MIQERDLLEQIKSTASGGLCQITHEGARCVLVSIRELCEARIEALEADRPAEAAAGLPASQEPKYTVTTDAIVSRASGRPIPSDEPVFILRARDYHARDTLIHYLSKILRNGSNPHADAVLGRLRDFQRFADKNSNRMKHPDTEQAAPVTGPESSARVDAALGLVELPKIRVTRALYGQIAAGALGEGWIVQSYVRELLAASIDGAAALIRVRAALSDYHHALDTRQHGGVAQSKLAHDIEAALGTPWVQGATLQTAVDGNTQ